MRDIEGTPSIAPRRRGSPVRSLCTAAGTNRRDKLLAALASRMLGQRAPPFFAELQGLILLWSLISPLISDRAASLQSKTLAPLSVTALLRSREEGRARREFQNVAEGRYRRVVGHSFVRRSELLCSRVSGHSCCKASRIFRPCDRDGNDSVPLSEL